MALAVAGISIVGIVLIHWLYVKMYDRQRVEWSAERTKLLDRIQAGNFGEYKAQERADRPVVRRDKQRDPLEKEPYL
jgi:hypothetical protein